MVNYDRRGTKDVLTARDRAAADSRGHVDNGADAGISTCSNVTKVNRQRKRSRIDVLLFFRVLSSVIFKYRALKS